jgi:carbamoyl-phosphate synthase large subunit
MKSTGEVMGVDFKFELALYKALLAAGLVMPAGGSILLSIADRDKAEALPLIKKLNDLDYNFYATEGTSALIEQAGMDVKMITKKLHEGHPNVVDIIKEGKVDGVVNTVTGNRVPLSDGFEIRRAAVERRIPCYTSLDTLGAIIDVLNNPIKDYHTMTIKEYRQGC